jgi:hypothetical protein
MMNAGTNESDRQRRQRLLSEYAAGQLGADDARQAERLLAEDASAREDVRQYAALADQLAELGRTGPPGVDYDAQRADILRALERRALLEGPGAGRVRRRWRVLVPLAAAAALVIAAVAMFLATRTPPAGPADEEVFAAVLPASPRPSGPATVVAALAPATAGGAAGAAPLLALRPGGWQELPMSALKPAAPSSLPPGTVMVSAGAVDGRDALFALWPLAAMSQ